MEDRTDAPLTELEEEDEGKSYIPLEGSKLEAALAGSDLQLLLSELPEIEQQVILMRNGLGGYEQTTIDRTAQLLGYSREWGRQLENRALARLVTLAVEQPGIKNE